MKKQKILKYLILIFILSLYIYYGYKSGLDGGLIVGIISIILIYKFFNTLNIEYIYTYYVVVFLIGNFKLIKSVNYFFYDLTLLMSMCTFIYLLVIKKIDKIILILFGTLLISVIFYSDNSFDKNYIVLATFMHCIVFAYLLFINKQLSKTFSNLLILLSMLIIIISILQMIGFEIKISNPQEAYYRFYDLKIYRPTGTTGDIYRTGSQILLSLFIISWHYKSSSFAIFIKNNKYLIYMFLLLSFSTVIVSQRSFFIGIILVIFLFFLNNIENKKLKISIFFIYICIILVIVYKNLTYLDNSNIYKILMSIEIINYFIESSIIKQLFGHGVYSTNEILNNNNLEWLVEYFNINDFRIQAPSKNALPHNVYIQNLYEFGLIYVAIYIFIIIKVINRYFSQNYNYDKVFFLIMLFLINYSLHNGIINISITFLSLYLYLTNDNNIRKRGE